jgi:hypothetical protein
MRADCVAMPFARSYVMIPTPHRIGRRPGGLLIVATFVLDGPTAKTAGSTGVLDANGSRQLTSASGSAADRVTTEQSGPATASRVSS